MSILRSFAISIAGLGLLGAYGSSASAETATRLIPVEAPAQPIRAAGKIGSAPKVAAAGTTAARNDSSTKSEASPTQVNEPSGAQPGGPSASANDPDLIGGPFKVTVPGQGSAPAAATLAPAMRATAPADVPTPPAAASNVVRPADVGPTRTILEQGSQSRSAQDSQARSAQATSRSAQATSRSAQATFGSVLTATAATSAAADASCFAGCYTPTSTTSARTAKPTLPQRQDRGRNGEARATSTTGVAAPASSQFTCVAGCDEGGAGAVARSTVAAPDAGPGATSAGSAKGTGRVTVLRGSSRTKTYGVKQ